MKLKYVILLFFLAYLSGTNFAQENKSSDAIVQSIKRQKGSFENAIVRYLRSKNNDELSSELMEEIEVELDANNSADYPEACFLIAKFYLETGEQKKAYFHFYKTLKNAPDLSDQSKAYLPQFHEKFGICYFYFKRYEESTFHLKKALTFENCTKSSAINIYNTLGLIYRIKKKPKNSKYYFQKAYQIAEDEGEDAWVGVVSGNLGFHEYEAKNYDEARRLLTIDMEISRKNNQNTSEFNALTTLIEITLIHGGTDDVEQMIERINVLRELEGSITIQKAYYKIMAFYLEVIGDYKNALINQKLERELHDSILVNRDELAIRNYEFQIDFERKQAELEVLEEKREKDSFVFYGIIIFLLTLLLALFLIVRQVLKRRKKEKEIYLLKQAKIEDELKSSEKELKSIVSTLIDKNVLIEELKSKIEIGDANLELNEHQEELLETLHSFTLLTEDDWITFKNVFEKLHPGFFIYFRKEYPECTTAEIRLAALIRLNLTNSEMANALGISPNSVRKTSLRLRKKLDISSVDLLAKFILELQTPS